MEEDIRKKYGIKPEIFSLEDIYRMVPSLKGHPKLVNSLLHFLWLDRCNDVHSKYCYETGINFARLLVDEAFRFKLRVDNEEILDSFPDKPFITVSNHPFGSYDGIILMALVGKHRPDYKVMVNMFLNYITAMRPAFIAVDPIKTDDPEKKRVTMHGIREAMERIKEGHPVGFFPAGAVSKIDRSLHISDREWQPTIIRLIRQMKVPVVPIYFHGHNSTFFNILGLIDWRLRSLRLPRELFRKVDQEVHVSIGYPISPELQAECKTLEDLGKFLREETYKLKEYK